MRFYPSLEEARHTAGTGSFHQIPIRCEILSDFCTPIGVLRILKAHSHHCYLLESAKDSETWGRYSFLGYDPGLEVTCKDGVVTLRDGTKRTVQRTRNPGAVLRQLLDLHKSPRLEGMPPFTGGLVGYFSYDYIKYAEPTLALEGADQECFQDLDLMVFTKVIVFDHYRQKLLLIANASTENLDHSYGTACQTLRQMVELLRTGTPASHQRGQLSTPLRPLFQQSEYCSMVEQAKQHIYEGDIFQVVLSNRLEAGYEGSLLDTYRVLRTVNPSPYLFYFSSDDIELAGASPETLVKLEGDLLHTFPLAGTRPRGSTPEEDASLEAELLADEKERSEHNMLVDLGRNDIGRVSAFGTVQVEKYQSVERFSHVMHLGSTVSGRLRPGLDALDALAAVLPAGTLSGAPKLRACQIIHELEQNKRGIYGGAIGYLDYAGNMDTCIAIRLVFKKNGKVFIRSGAGIVADSEPEREYQECINKARAVVSALELAQEEADL